MVSVVIPTLNEELRLPACLEAVLGSVSRSGAEVVVVDGGSTDSTREIARRCGVRVIECPRGRGRQMNAGARAAEGSLLVFLHADTVLPREALDVLAEIDRAGCPRVGGFRQRFDMPRATLRVVSFLHNLRVRLTGIVYGDQTLFARRSLFEEVGGFREDADLEDLELGERLRKIEKPRLLDLHATTSARRFTRFGDLTATFRAAWILASWVLLRRVPRSRTFFEPVR